MKSPLTRLALLALATFLALSTPRILLASEKSPAPEPKASPAKFQLTWSRGAPPGELKFVQEKLRLAEARFQTGNASREELVGLRQDLERIEERAPYRLTIESSGGTLREFLAATSSGAEVSFTLVNAGDPADLETPLPAFNLRNVSWATVAEVLANFVATRGLQLKHTDLGNQDGAKSIICVLRRDRASAESDRPAKSEFTALQLGEVIYSAQRIETIVDLIRTAWEFDPAHDAAALRLKYHPDTKILLVSGPAPAATVAERVVASLRKKQF